MNEMDGGNGMRRSADKISGDLVKLLGRKVLFTKHRIKPGTVPDGMRLYEVGSHWQDHGKPEFLMNRRKCPVELSDSASPRRVSLF